MALLDPNRRYHRTEIARFFRDAVSLRRLVSRTEGGLVFDRAGYTLGDLANEAYRRCLRRKEPDHEAPTSDHEGRQPDNPGDGLRRVEGREGVRFVLGSEFHPAPMRKLPMGGHLGSIEMTTE